MNFNSPCIKLGKMLIVQVNLRAGCKINEIIFCMGLSGTLPNSMQGKLKFKDMYNGQMILIVLFYIIAQN